MPESNEMIKVYFGDDRVRAIDEIRRWLGTDYEVFDGNDLEERDLPSLFLGNSLFDVERKILIRDFATNKSVLEKIIDYIDTPHRVALFDSKISKNSVFYKNLSKKVEFKEFKLPKENLYNQVVAMYNMAKKDGKKAVEMLERIKNTEEPVGLIGIIANEALNEFERHPGKKEKRVLLELSKLDMEMKSTSISSWSLLSIFLLQLSSFQP